MSVEKMEMDHLNPIPRSAPDADERRHPTCPSAVFALIFLSARAVNAAAQGKKGGNETIGGRLQPELRPKGSGQSPCSLFARAPGHRQGGTVYAIDVLTS